MGKVLIPFDHEKGLRILENQCGFSRDDIRSKIFASRELTLYQTGKISSEEFFREITRIINLEIDFAEFSRIWNHSFTFAPIIDEAIIESLSKRFRMLILSDTNPLHFEFIRENFPVLRHFDEFVLSYEVGFQKPAPEIFLAAVERANCRARECFFTDDIAANADAARRTGIKAVQFVSPEQFRVDLDKIIANEQ